MFGLTNIHYTQKEYEHYYPDCLCDCQECVRLSDNPRRWRIFVNKILELKVYANNSK